MEFPLGNNGGRGKPKGKTLATYLRDMLSDNDKATGRPIKALLAEKAIKIALDEKTNHKDFMYLIEQFMDRETGKPVSTNINADIGQSPFDGIDTAKLEALRAKLQEVCLKKEEEPKPEEPK